MGYLHFSPSILKPNPPPPRKDASEEYAEWTQKIADTEERLENETKGTVVVATLVKRCMMKITISLVTITLAPPTSYLYDLQICLLLNSNSQMLPQKHRHFNK
jgi:hypothetical protein